VALREADAASFWVYVNEHDLDSESLPPSVQESLPEKLPEPVVSKATLPVGAIGCGLVSVTVAVHVDAWSL
jgi:hypothetical protein